jgi:anti-sigma regulatory factor (Ser/Thr protein kinase)
MTVGTEREDIVFSVPGGPLAPSRVRSQAYDALGEHLSEDRLADLSLLLSEVVTNSVRHGRVAEDGRIDVTLEVKPTAVRATVTDTGVQGNIQPRTPDYEDGGGFGLFLVDMLASDWRAEHTPGLVVWFELSTEPSSRDRRRGPSASDRATEDAAP